MDPLSALAVAAAVFQFLDLGGKFCVKGWEKYKQMQQKIPDDQKLAEEEELRKTFEDLSFQITWIRQISANIMVSQPPTPVQVQLLELLSECSMLSSEFERIKSQMRPPNSQERNRNSEIHLGEHVSFGRRLQEKDCRECQKRKDEANAEVQRNKKDIEGMRGKLEPLKRKIIDFIFISLWDDSKRTKQWGLQFSNQLDKLIDLLGSAEKLIMVTRLKPALSNEETSSQDRHHFEEYSQDCIQELGTDEEVVRLRNALQPLVQPEKGPLSLKQLADGMIEHLKTDNGAINAIRGELVNVLWETDWKLDVCMAGNSSAKIDTSMVAHAIAKGIQFNNIQTREEAISKNSEKTYSWIFQDEPPTKDGMPMWNSFPRWLEDDSKTAYWITGKPGSGKSTIMKLILQQPSVRDTLSQSLGSLRLLLVKYYAWLPGHTLQNSIEGLKRTVIFQALEQYPDLAPKLTPRRWALCQVLRSISGLPMWNSWEVDESFEALLSSCGKTIKLALFIDGLDEFDTPAIEVIKCIQHITVTCSSAVKICAASRPWTEFQDEFSESPMLQMHLLTEKDMKIFIDENFKNNKGFIEQKQLNPGAASELLMDIVQRANGVFLWVSIVVQHLSTSFSEGQSISQARQTLEALPTDISSLYDAIWAGIRPELLPEASDMIQLMRAFDSPMPWLTAWVIEESRFHDVTTVMNDALNALELCDVALKSLRRKLGARTKCILEISGSGNNADVDFIHRTARDWAVQPAIWRLICSSSSGQFDPHLTILKAETIILSITQPSQTQLWDAIAKALWHAGEVKDIPENGLDLVNCLNSLNKHFITLSFMNDAADDDDWDRLALRRRQNLYQLWFISPNFIGLTTQFSILSYIKAVTLSDRRHLSQPFSEDSLGLLENAIFGYSYYISPGFSQVNFRPRIPHSRRLATVKYLLEQGVYQSKMHSANEICSLREELRKITPTDPEYYSTVAMYLDERDVKSRIRSIELRIKSFFFKSWV